MKKSLCSCDSIIKFFRKIQARFFPTAFDRAAAKWFEDDGDGTLRQEFALNENSFVMDVGGFKGQWASDIFSRYLCHIAIFEPVKEYAALITKRFAQNKRINVFDFGLAGHTKQAKISLAGESSSIYRSTVESAEIALHDICEWLDKNDIKSVDLIKINIEGGEYELLNRILQSGNCKIFKRFLVQFHNIDKQSERNMKLIHEIMQENYKLIWQYPFIWEYWEIRDK